MSESFEDQLATAFVAKMAGMTLKQVDDSTTHRAGVPATRIDPASFLTVVHEKKKQEQQRQAEELNRLAEQMYPLPPPVQLPPLEPPKQPIITETPTNISNIVASPEIVDVLKSIDSSIKEFVEYFRVSVKGVKK
jgi:hypothetical protein